MYFISQRDCKRNQSPIKVHDLTASIDKTVKQPERINVILIL